MYYFSYGSNMSTQRILERVPSAERIGIGVLEQHELKFHKISKDGSAKCDARKTGNAEHVIYGVLFLIPESEKNVLDRKEGLGNGYEEKNVLIRVRDGSEVHAFTYYATNTDSSLKPFDWYKEHVVRGARENSFPDDYVRIIEAIEFHVDTDSKRRDKELSIYR